LFGESGLLDEKQIQFGIRDIGLELKDQDTGEDRFGFRINDKMIFMNGANWAPLEGFTHVWNEERAQTLVDLMKNGNFNFLRIWGVGSIPSSSLLERCDQAGIIVWMDFMTSKTVHYPIHDAGFRANITAEIEDQIKRLRNHACIALWCGGNEHYLQFPSNEGDNSTPLGRELFQKIMPDLVGQFDSQRPFQPSSPWGGDNWPNGNYPLTGDFHDYSAYRFQPIATVPLFTSEVCMVSPYAAHQMKRFMSGDDFWPEGFEFKIDSPGKRAWPHGWEKYTLRSAWEKIGRIQDYCDIQTAEDACRVFGTAHGEYLKERYERQRRGVLDGQADGTRRSWGAAIWRLNDTWPMIYMSVIDYYLEPKIPYYFLKRACEPVLISFEQTDERICVWIVNDSPLPVEDTLHVELRTFEGEMKKHLSRKVNITSTEAKRVVDLTFEFGEIWKRREFLVARLGDQVVSHLLWPEKFLSLGLGIIQAKVDRDTIILKSNQFIKDVALRIPHTSGAVFSDNYFNLIPGEVKTIQILNKAGGNSLEITGVNCKTDIIDI
jgi:beta-mannosidase